VQQTFRAMIVEETEPRKFTREIRDRSIDDLPAGDLLVKVHYSSLNYKDALSATGRPGVTRHYPHTPGIDAAGVVAACADGTFTPGDSVLVTGYDLGMDTAGGYGQYIRIPSEWAVPLPAGLSLREGMILGTAGFTAGLSVYKLMQNGVQPGDGEVLVTGASGGVGSIAVAILARTGYRVVAATGKAAENDYLRGLGAAEVIGRDQVLAGSERPMMKERWAGVVDVVGGDMLAAAVKSTRYGGTVTCFGLGALADLNVTVFPLSCGESACWESIRYSARARCAWPCGKSWPGNGNRPPWRRPPANAPCNRWRNRSGRSSAARVAAGRW